MVCCNLYYISNYVGFFLILIVFVRTYSLFILISHAGGL